MEGQRGRERDRERGGGEIDREGGRETEMEGEGHRGRERDS